MSVNRPRFDYLLQKYLDKSATADEFKEFFEYLQKDEYKEAILGLMEEENKLGMAGTKAHAIDWERMYAQIVDAPEKSIFNFTLFTRLAAAAVLLCCIGTGIYFGVSRNSVYTGKEHSLVKNEVAPGGNKAVLTLSDGRSIILDASGKGKLAEQGNTTVTKPEEGTLVYNATANSSDKIAYNTLSTPRGGQYMIVLPDQTKAWLNSASSITFPTHFTGSERNVEINGEVYFEVAKLTGHTFKVSSGRATVTVLGTHFNMMSYPDEKTAEVTLLEGSIRLNVGSKQQLLIPGQLASYQEKSDFINVTTPELPDARIDWKNGLFQFENESIQQIMRKVSRWYNKDIVYEGAAIDKHFTGTIPRNNNLSKVLNLLRASGGINFRVKDDVIIVTDNVATKQD